MPLIVPFCTVMLLALFATLGGSALGMGLTQPAPGSWSIPRLDIEVALDPAAGLHHSRAELRLRRDGSAADRVTLVVGEGTRIVSVEGASAVVAPDGRSVVVTTGQPLEPGGEITLQVAFRSEGRMPQLVVAPEGALASWAQGWYPVPEEADPAAPGRTVLRLPRGWEVVSNGALDERREEGGEVVVAWESELPTARSFAAGPYRVETREVGAREVQVYLLEPHAARADEYVATLAAILVALEARFGPYPYPSYALAEVSEGLVPWSGSSEQGFFMAGSDELDAARVNVPLFAHELAHGWWGNRVRAVAPASLMTGEALAQYGAVLAIEALEGPEAALEFMRFSREGYNSVQSAKGYWALRIAGHDKPLAELTGDGQDHNLADAKGHWVYHMLRQRVGDDIFFATLRRILDDHGGGTLSLPELRSAFVAAAPEADLDTFFAEWLDRQGAPVLSTSWEDASEPGRFAARVTIRQRTPEPWHVGVRLAIESDAGRQVHRVELSEARTTIVLEAAGPPTGVTENVDGAVLLWEAAYCPEE